MVCSKLQSSNRNKLTAPLPGVAGPCVSPPGLGARSVLCRFRTGWIIKAGLILLPSLFPMFLPAQTAEDYFHGGATNYVFGEKEKAKEQIVTGLQNFPSDPKLNQLLALMKKEEEQKQQQQKNDQNKEQKQNQDSQKKDSEQKKDSQQNKSNEQKNEQEK